MSNPIVDFCLTHIYKQLPQDDQFSIRLVRVNKPNVTSRSIVAIYGINKLLPDTTNRYHVYIVGQINTNAFNLLRDAREWFRDTWVNFKDDINTRNTNIMLYDNYGRIVPREFCYYSFIDEKSLCICVREHPTFKKHYNYNNIKYLRVYSNAYFKSQEYNNLPNKIGIKLISNWVFNNVDKAQLQIQANDLISNYSGGIQVYVNGIYYSDLSLLIENESYIEVFYDQSIIDKTYYPISSLRSFNSTIDDCDKYLLYTNQSSMNYMQFFDDYDYFVTTITTPLSKGLYYYRHNPSSIRNVTDKDYSLKAQYVNNYTAYIDEIFNNNEPKQIVLYRRKSGDMYSMVYSNLKLHELYKLDNNLQLDVINSTRYSFTDLRCEVLENSMYFKIAESNNMLEVTKEKCIEALGYDSICYYFAYNLFKTNSTILETPLLYRNNSTVFEYDNNGLYLNYYSTSGPYYTKNNPQALYYEFIYGNVITTLDRLYNGDESITLQHNEFKIFKSLYNLNIQVTPWEELTSSEYTINNNILTTNLNNDYKLFIFYNNTIIVDNYTIDINDGLMYFPIVINQDRGNGVQNYVCDFPFRNIEIYLNKHKLTKGLDYFINFPYINICNKKFLNYTSTQQNVEIRMYGITLNKDEINMLEDVGFINHDTLSRNNQYDIRDDRILAFYVDGKIRDRSELYFAEEDNTVRTYHPNNGKPYIIKQPFTPLKTITDINTDEYFYNSVNKNKRFSEFFTTIKEQPPIDQFNVIDTKYYIFSPIISKIITDMLLGIIPSSFYSTPYNDSDIINLVDNNYKDIYNTDPVKYNLPLNIVEIHPHLGNTTINVSLLQYRFINNCIRVLTNSTINLSGYLTITT